MRLQYAAAGKQVLLGTAHICDAASNETAEQIATGLNAPEYLEYLATRQKSTGVRMALQVAAGNLRAGFEIPELETANG